LLRIVLNLPRSLTSLGGQIWGWGGTKAGLVEMLDAVKEVTSGDWRVGLPGGGAGCAIPGFCIVGPSAEGQRA
jgi:hypothetical protein